MSNKKKAALLMVAAAFVYALLSATVKWIQGIPVFEKMFFRTFFGLVFVSIIVVKDRIPVKGTNRFALIGRGVTGFISTFLYYMALSYAPIAETVTLSNTYPFLLAIFCWIFLGEKIKPFHIAALALSFIGAVLIIRPGFSDINFYYIIAVLSSVFMAVTYTFLRKARETENSQVIVLWYSAICTVGCIPVMFMEKLVIPTPFQFIQLISLGIIATVYQLMMSQAYKYAQATEVSIYSYTTIIFSAVLGIIIWSEIPGVFTVIGAILIVSGAYVIFRGQNSKEPPSQSQNQKTQ
ncbi:MAG: DMT family transporter [Bacillota bacterium]|nr:DMT family transporter [Bacillota bacterium]